MDKLQQKLDSLQVPVGYTTSLGLMATPVWLEAVTNWLQFGAVVIGIMVGLTTFWLNIEKIRKARKKG